MQYFIRNKKGKLRALMFVLSSIIFITPGCYRDKAEILYPGSNTPVECSTVPASFNADVKPLILSKCAIPGCHDGTASGGLIFQTYNQIFGNTDRINVRALVQKTMPPTGPLPPSEASKIRCWIEGGALNN